MTTLKLKNDFTFSEKSICFGVGEIKGSYHLQNDTIFFDKVQLGRHENEFYEYAIVAPSKIYKDGKHFYLVRYKNKNDTIGHELSITKNKLNELKENSSRKY